jgi:hypothetical protein
MAAQHRNMRTPIPWGEQSCIESRNTTGERNAQRRKPRMDGGDDSHVEVRSVPPNSSRKKSGQSAVCSRAADICRRVIRPLPDQCRRLAMSLHDRGKTPGAWTTFRTMAAPLPGKCRGKGGLNKKGGNTNDGSTISAARKHLLPELPGS